ncbi:Inositol 2-dehydrogenase/D-chiro-inositol 3-dehydrogenase [Mycovorax composti]|jgi:Predicted dehydrogenases and related proteins|uniref:Inositol 2-dehydrogenase/D-chiro-inositol 3-dehydrogenase n=1 Tax=Mycovorax composti TaxID=2962693 RepID=A0ABZ2EHD5_9BACT
MNSRRKFIYQTSALALGSLALQSFNSKNFSFINKSASDTIKIGVIGIKGMGWSNTQSILKVPGTQIVALCDVDKSVLDERMTELQKKNIDTSKIKTYGDYRKLLENKDVDVVIIGTPDHWHALMMIDAVAAGKDVYVEKPVGNSIEECKAMVAAQKKYNRIVQAGQWQRSQQHFREAVEFVQSGKLGNIRTVKVCCYQGWMKPAPVVPDSAPPPGVDYKMWLGPAKTRPFNSSRFHFNFRWFWDYAGGLMTDWGVHLMDYALLGMKASLPKTVSALGGKFAYPELAQETPDTLTALYEFDGFNIIWDHAMGIDNGNYNRDHSIAFIGNNGTLVLSRGGWEVIEEKRSENKVLVPFKGRSDNGLDKHMENFVEVLRSRKQSDLNCSIEAGAHIATVCQIGNIAFRSGQKLVWDKAAGKFTDEKINQQYLMAPYHNGYKLPKI